MRSRLPLALFLLCFLASPFTVGQSERLREPPTWPSADEYLSSSRPTEADSPPAQEAAEPSPAPVAELSPAPAPTPAAAAVLGAFTVQLGAFQEYRSAQAFAEEVGADGVLLLSTQRDGVTWYLVVLDSYPSRSEADAAEASYRDDHPAAATWVRGTTGLELR